VCSSDLKLAGAKLVMVLGHTECGAVKGACDGAELGNLIYDLTRPHSYILAFWLGGAVFMVGTLFLLLMIKPRLS
jgi:hypothetical protein